jgi:hypothetical protein
VALLFRIKKTEIVDVIVEILRQGGGWGWGQLVSSKEPEWMGIHHHEQDVGLPITGFFIAQGVTPRYY